MQRIVVGVDGSENAREALRFAVSEARLRGTAIDAVMAWHRPYTTSGDVWTLPMPIDVAGIEDSYRSELEGIVGEVEHADVEVRPVLVEGSPARSLLDAAEDAALLVVGSRGHGGFIGLLLGSVSHQVAAHAPCPVVIVPGPAEAE